MNINLSIQELLALFDNVISCTVDPSAMVGQLRSLQHAGPSDLAVVLERGDASVFDAVALKNIQESAAGFLLAQNEVIPGRNYIIVKDVLVAFEKLVTFLERRSACSSTQYTLEENVFVQASAVIGAGARIGAGSCVSAQVFIGKECVIGKNVLLHPGVKILDRCVVGDNSIIHAGAVIGSDGFGYEVTKTGLKKIPQVGIVRIGNSVEIGANCMIDRASFDETVIGDGVKMDNGVHIAHNVVIGPCTAILAQTGIAGSVTIGAGCQIGGQVAIKDHVTIGNHVKIVSKSGVMNDLKDGETVAGIPAIQFSQWKRLAVCLNKLPELVRMASDMQKFQGATKSPVRSWLGRLFQAR